MDLLLKEMRRLEKRGPSCRGLAVDEDRIERLACAAGLTKAYNEVEPRIPKGSGQQSGEWTSGAAASADGAAASRGGGAVRIGGTTAAAVGAAVASGAESTVFGAASRFARNWAITRFERLSNELRRLD